MTRTLKWTAGVLAALALGAMALLAWWPGGAGAQEGGETPAPDATAEAAPDGEAKRFFFGRHGGPLGLRLDDAFLADVAARLGITEQALRDAVDAVAAERYAERLQAAVDAGRLAQAEADAMLQAFRDGTLSQLLRERAAEQLAERLARAVQNGRLTQEEADAMLEAFESGSLRALPREGFRFFERHAPRFRFSEPAPEGSATPEDGQSSTSTVI